MNQKQLLYFVFTLLVTVGMLLITSPITVSAEIDSVFDDFTEMTNETEDIEESKKLSPENEEKAKEIISNLKEQLSKLGVPIGYSKLLENLDEETKKKAELILKNKKEGIITHEEAKKQLAEIGVELPEHKFLEGLDDETKNKAKDIFKQVHEGKITRDEAKTKLQELGIEIPNYDEIENLDEETKEKVGSLIEDTRSRLNELGLNLPKRFERILEKVEE